MVGSPFGDDYEAWRKLKYWEQWDALVAYGMRTGNRAALGSIAFHMLVFAATAAVELPV